jgi:hypothetical protein
MSEKKGKKIIMSVTGGGGFIVHTILCTLGNTVVGSLYAHRTPYQIQKAHGDCSRKAILDSSPMNLVDYHHDTTRGRRSPDIKPKRGRKILVDKFVVRPKPSLLFHFLQRCSRDEHEHIKECYRHNDDQTNEEWILGP